MSQNKINITRNRKAISVKVLRQRNDKPCDLSRTKLWAVAWFFGCAWLALWLRAFSIQVIDGLKLAQLANRQHLASELVSGERGNIFDRRGMLLATSLAVKSVYARPLDVEDAGRISKVLADLLNLPQKDLFAKLSARKHFVWLSRKIPDAIAQAVEKAELKGIYLTSEFGRQYPNTHLAGQLIGFVGLDEQGLEGLEKAYNDYLAGRQSRYTVQRDATGRKLHFDTQSQEPDVRGKDLRLTLDANLQFETQEALARSVQKYGGHWGGCLVVDVPTGEILAWAEYPLFNPNSYKQYGPKRWRNGLAINAMEIGSTLKPILVAAALQERTTHRDKVYFCENGRAKFGIETVRDTHKYQWLPVHKIIRYSSNIGAAKIGLELGAVKYHNYLTRVGFGEKTNLDLPGEGRGILHPLGDWNDMDLATASFGQGLAVTIPQLVRAYLCLANDGILKPLKLVLDPEEPNQTEKRIFTASVTREVLAMMRDVVEEDGTGTAARISGMSIAGKTGTAQKASPHGGYGNKYIASFVGFVPAEKPQYLIVVAVDEPEANIYGGVVSAPAFQEIAVKTLAYTGKLPDPQMWLKNSEDDVNDTEHKNIWNSAKKVAWETAKRNSQDKPKTIDTGTVPDVVGFTLRRAMELFAANGLVPTVKGEGLVVVRQQPAPGQLLPKVNSEKCTFWLASAAER
ncbi:cell division protein FtsI (penicillin-binding protein 3) [Desulfovibrionales bacterium]